MVVGSSLVVGATCVSFPLLSRAAILRHGVILIICIFLSDGLPWSFAVGVRCGLFGAATSKSSIDQTLARWGVVGEGLLPRMEEDGVGVGEMGELVGE